MLMLGTHTRYSQAGKTISAHLIEQYEDKLKN